MIGDHDRRVFLALPIDRETQGLVAPFLEAAVEKFPEVLWCDPRGLHLTLHFFGYLDSDRIAVVHDVVSELTAKSGKLKLSLSSMGFFPDAGRPRIIWAGVKGQTAALSQLQSALSEKLRTAGFEIDPRPFSPHVTLGRVKRKPLPADFSRLQFPECPERLFSEIALYESQSTPQGSRYEILETFSLRQAPPL